MQPHWQPPLLGYAVDSLKRGLMVSGVLKQSSVRRWLRRGVLALCALPVGVTGAWAQAGAAPVVLQLCYERIDILPWRTVDGRGLNIELIRMAAGRAGVTVQFVTLPWKRCMSEMQDGTVQGVFAASFVPDRLAFGAYPGGNPADPNLQLYADGYVLVRRKTDPVQWDGKSVSGLKGPVGAQVGYSVVNDLRRLGVPVDEGSQSARELLQKLQLGRVGAAALGNSDAAKLLGTDDKPTELGATLEALPVPLVQKAYFLMLSNHFVQDRPDVANRLWQQIAVARRSTEYQKRVADVGTGRQP